MDIKIGDTIKAYDFKCTFCPYFIGVVTDIQTDKQSGIAYLYFKAYQRIFGANDPQTVNIDLRVPQNGQSKQNYGTIDLVSKLS